MSIVPNLKTKFKQISLINLIAISRSNRLSLLQLDNSAFKKKSERRTELVVLQARINCSALYHCDAVKKPANNFAGSSGLRIVL